VYCIVNFSNELDLNKETSFYNIEMVRVLVMCLYNAAFKPFMATKLKGGRREEKGHIMKLVAQ
jgi:hypothetical protein